MRPELIGFTILSIAVGVVGLLLLADRKGWRSPLPGLRLSPRWYIATYVLAALLIVLQALRYAQVL